MALPASPPVTGSSGPSHNPVSQLTLAVAGGIALAYDRGAVLRPPLSLLFAEAELAIAVVADHIRAATNDPDQLDPRIDRAIDDFFAPPFPRREADGTIAAIDDDGVIVQRGRSYADRAEGTTAGDAL